MPELPEVETIVRGLNKQVRGLTIRRVSYIAPHLLHREPRLRTIEGDRFDSFERRGKYIIASLGSGRQLLVHLRMSGRLLVRDDKTRREKHEHLEIVLSDFPRRLLFRDLRKFGVCELLGEKQRKSLTCLGPEATAITPRQLHQRLQHSRRPIKSLLLDQNVIAGIGNIYADESLYLAGIHPTKAASSLTFGDTQRLVRALRSVLRRAINEMGTTFDSFRGVNGDSGGFARYLRVYHQTGATCSRCGDIIKRIKIGGRGTHYCPTCQSEKKKRQSRGAL